MKSRASAIGWISRQSFPHHNTMLAQHCRRSDRRRCKSVDSKGAIDRIVSAVEDVTQFLIIGPERHSYIALTVGQSVVERARRDLMRSQRRERRGRAETGFPQRFVTLMENGMYVMFGPNSVDTATETQRWPVACECAVSGRRKFLGVALETRSAILSAKWSREPEMSWKLH